jgi:hypothetical protein
MDITSLIGKNVFVRTVTNYYTGHLISCHDGFLHLEAAAWIADTGRFATALETGRLNEVEPFPADCWVAAGSVVDLCVWSHELPRTQK